MNTIPGELGGRIDVDDVEIVVHPSGVGLHPQPIPIALIDGVIVEPPTRLLNGQLAIRYRDSEGRTRLSYPVVFRRGWGAERMLSLATWLQAVARANAAAMPMARAHSAV